MLIASPDHATMIGKIYSAQAKFMVDHAWGRLTIELSYAEGNRKVTAQIESLSVDFDQEICDCTLGLSELGLLMEHAVKVLSERTDEKSMAGVRL